MIIVCSVRKTGDIRRVIDPTTKIQKCQAVQTNVRWPAPVDQRLNELLDRLSSAGEEATRSQLLAALVANAPAVGLDLAKVLAKYRRATAGRVVLQRDGPIVVIERRPGRRPR
jgi:hypothetical protein